MYSFLNLTKYFFNMFDNLTEKLLTANAEENMIIKKEKFLTRNTRGHNP